jgi:hypothetical protein
MVIHSGKDAKALGPKERYSAASSQIYHISAVTDTPQSRFLAVGFSGRRLPD